MTVTGGVFTRDVAEVLARCNVGVKPSRPRADGTVWFHFLVCPVCGKKVKGEECGVSDKRGVKCWHVGDRRVGYQELLQRIGAFDRYPLQRYSSGHVGAYTPPARAVARPSSETAAAGASRSARGRPPSEEWLQRQAARLRRTPAAMEYLRRRGLTDETVQRFRLGLTLPNRKTPSHDALAFPILGPAGELLPGRTGYYDIPGLTVAPKKSGGGWAWGTPVTTYYAEPVGAQRAVMVCEGFKDLWRIWQEAQGTGLAASTLLITSTSGNQFPPEWETSEFWARWRVIYAAQDADETGDLLAEKLAGAAPEGTVFRLRVPPGITAGTNTKKPGKDWTDFFLAGRTADDLKELIATAPPVAVRIGQERPEGEGGEEQFGRLAYRPVDITSALVNGKLYYPVETIIRERKVVRVASETAAGDNGAGEPAGRVVVTERIETVVIGSDRKVHTPVRMPAPEGVGDARRVWRLMPDRVMLQGPPKQNRYATWSWPAIDRWMRGEFPVRPLAEIVADIEDHFRRSFWLPYEEDYTLLALTSVVTYVQPVFDAVPLILVNGPAGTGKSTIGLTMAQVCFNASTVGAVSAAAVARHIDESRGFVALDDLEGVGSKRQGQDAAFSDLVQALKLSYNRETAIKIWVDTKSMQTKTLNFFGVKVLTNTSGVDNILGSRMFRVQTRRIPDALDGQVQLSRAADLHALHGLRDELHAWAFDNVPAVVAAYARVCPHRTDRQDEIAAPLRTIAELAQDPGITARLEAVISRQRDQVMDPDDPEEVFKEAVAALVGEGYWEISPTHVVLEMTRMMGVNYGKEFTNEIPEWQRADWAGKRLRSLEVIEPNTKGERPRLDWGMQLRVYPVRRGYIREVLGEEGVARIEAQRAAAPAGAVRAVDFCRGCTGCSYRPHCRMVDQRVEWEQRRALRRN